MKGKCLCLIFMVLCFRLIGQDKVNNTFWEKVDCKVIYEEGVFGTDYWDKTLYQWSMACNDSGVIIMTNGHVNENFMRAISFDAGKNWKVELINSDELRNNKLQHGESLTTFRDKFISNRRVFGTGTGRGDEERYVLESTDGINWEVVEGEDPNTFKDYLIVNGSREDLGSAYRSELKNLVYHGNRTISISENVKKYHFDKSIKGFTIDFPEPGNSVPGSDSYFWLGRNWRKLKPLFKLCNGKTYFQKGIHGVLQSTKPEEYYPLITGFFKHKSGSAFHGIIYEENSIEGVFCNHIFLSGIEKNTFENRLLYSSDGEHWEDANITGYNHLFLDYFPSANGISYNRATKRFFVFTNQGLFQSKKQYECDCDDSGVFPPPQPEYGTTVITHDRLYHPPIAVSYETWIQNMTEAILRKAGKGIAYLYNPESGRYQVWKKYGDKPEEGEHILIFDWHGESIIDVPGFTSEAAEALYLSLTHLKPEDIPLRDVHFIGHGRGCIVNSLAIEKLYQLAPEVSIDQVTNLGPHERDFDTGENSAFPNVVKPSLPDILVPDPSGSTLPSIPPPYSGIIKWDRNSHDITYSDTYWQNNGKKILYPLARFVILECLETVFDKIRNTQYAQGVVGHTTLNQIEGLYKEYVALQNQGQASDDKLDVILQELENLVDVLPIDEAKALGKSLGWFFRILALHDLYEDIANSSFDSNPVAGSSNYHWPEFEGKKVYHESSISPIQDYLGICDAYIKSIKTSEFGKCPVGPNSSGGYCLSRLNGGQGHRTSYKGTLARPFSYFDKDLNREVSGLLNGSFTRPESPNSAFFRIPGWDAPQKLPIIAIDGSIHLLPLGNSQPAQFEHLNFYLPADCRSIVFRVRSVNLKSGVIRVLIKGEDSGQIIQDTIRLSENIEKFKLRCVNIGPLSGEVVSMQTSFLGDALNSQKSIFPSLVIERVYLSQEEIKADGGFSGSQKMETIPTGASPISSAPAEVIPSVGITNGSFESLEGWEQVQGIISIEKETVALKPEAKRTGVILQHQHMLVPKDALQLKFKLHKARVMKGDIKLEMIDIETGDIELIYHEEVRVDPLSRINSDLEKVNDALQDYDFDDFKNEFVKRSVNVSKFQNKRVQLKITFLPMGSGRPKVFFDDISFN